MAVFTWTEAAWAQVPDDVAAVDQYRETIPTGAGKAGVGTKTKRGGKPLSTAARKSLQSEAADVAPVLEQVATSPAFGAPTESLRKSGPRGQPDRLSGPRVKPDDSGTAGSAEPSAASAAVSAVTGDAAPRVVGLLVVLFAISALAVGGAALRQRA
jgi:hypothetical protein